jgi:hypothetical protein
MSRTHHRIRSLGAALAAASALLVAAAPAHADTTECPAPQIEPSPFPGDPAKYVMAPCGNFEQDDALLAPWRAGGGTVAGDNARAGAGAHALQLTAGSTATSPRMTVGLNYPTLRFYARDTDLSATARVTVQVLFTTPDGVDRQLKIADPAVGDSWQPTRPVLILANLLALFPNWDGQVAFRFTASGGTVVIDDVYVDPYER